MNGDGGKTANETATTGLDLSGGLKPDFKGVGSIFVELDAKGKANVVFSGQWDGFTLRGAIRNIELEYKRFKQSAKRNASAKHGGN